MKIKIGNKHRWFWLQVTKHNEAPTKQFLGIEGIWIFGHSVVLRIFGRHFLNPPRQKMVSSRGMLEHREVFVQKINVKNLGKLNLT